MALWSVARWSIALLTHDRTARWLPCHGYLTSDLSLMHRIKTAEAPLLNGSLIRYRTSLREFDEVEQREFEPPGCTEKPVTTCCKRFARPCPTI